MAATDATRAPFRYRLYAVTPTSEGLVTVSLTDLTKDLDLVVLASIGGACEPRLPGCIGASSTLGNEAVTFTAEAGSTYYVVVDGFGTAAGSFSLDVDCP